ncbi:hypothetical protein CAP35_02265 [Chitinophagaceae bacterium IBVUCB1]|nr:hypothetical protein CAP35_02265 [Chitinophagaceae bacterium IBVUCB1]
MAINVMPYVDSNIIPLGLVYAPQRTYTLKVDEANMPTGTKLYLFDKYLNQQVELLSGGSYIFDVTSDSLSQGDKRFELRTLGKPTSVSSVHSQDGELNVAIYPNPATNNVKLKYETTINDIMTIEVSDLSGKIIYSSRLMTKNSGEETIGVEGLSTGIYIVKVKCGNKQTKLKLVKH